MWTLSLLVLSAIALAVDAFKIVQLEQGPVKGYKSSEGPYQFFGIPYATAPKGNDKFKASLPPPVWKETLEAVNADIWCPQANNEKFPLKVTMTEDCLVANIYVPETAETKLPVLVYVHGGAYHIGAGNMGTLRNMAKTHNIIALTFNYRLSVNGFLCLGTETAPGNAGMKDQVALLRWVQKNIAAFGGDPDNVSLAGGSAGSASVELLMLSDMARGLFNKVIPESGSALAPWGVQIDPIEAALSYARKLGYSGKSIADLETFYLNLPADKINFDHIFYEKDATFSLEPCIEKNVGVEMFLNKAPIDILKEGSYKKVPVLVGFANMEGLLRMEMFDKWSKDMNEKFSDFLPADLTFKNDAEKEEVANKIKQFYFGDKGVNNNTIESYIDFYSDTYFTYSILKSAKLQIENGNNNVYLYQYSFHDPVYHPFFNQYPQFKGATHCAQSSAVIDSGVNDESSIPEDFKKMKQIVRELWSSFYKTGVPTSSAWPAAAAWSAASGELSPHAELALPPRVRARLLPERFQLWDDIYDKHYRKPMPPTEMTKHTEL